jgi:iron complex outermembrane receptor protein
LVCLDGLAVSIAFLLLGSCELGATLKSNDELERSFLLGGAIMTFKTALWLSSALSILGANAALAQSSASTSSPELKSAEVIVVTGSRIAGNPLNAPQPVQSITASDLKVLGITNTGDALESVPALIASNNIEQTGRDGLAGRVSLNLRNMGVDRTLVLVNGRRHVAGIAGSAAVDIASIPSGLIERVDVLTGGASAVYGSDAVTGVVNFVTRKKFVGTEFEGQVGMSEVGDAGRVFFSVLHGRDFAGGKGNFALSVQAENREALFEGDRDFSRDNGLWTRDQNPELRYQAGDPLPPGVSARRALGNTILDGSNPRFANTPQAILDRARNARARAFGPNQVFSGSSTSGLIGLDLTRYGYADPAGAFNTAQDTNGNGIDDCTESFNGRRGFGCWVIDKSTGEVRPFRDGTYLGTFNQQGGDGAEQRFNANTMIPSTTSVALNFLTSYAFSDTMRAYGELKIVENRGKEYNVYNGFDDSIPISLENPYIPEALRAIVDAEIAADPDVAETAQFVVSKDFIDVFKPLNNNERTTYRGIAGIEGEIWGKWSYDVSVNYGRTQSRSQSYLRLEDRFFSALDVVIDPRTGQPTCRINLDPKALAPISALTPGWEEGTPSYLKAITTFDPASKSCQPINVFGVNSTDPFQNSFLNYRATDKSLIEQTVVQATLAGDSSAYFNLPGGPIGIVVGAEWRDESSEFIADPYKTSGYQFQFAKDADTKGGYDVTEGFVEMKFPIFSGVPFAEILSLDAAYRFGTYSTSGEADSWKIGLVWAPIEDIRFRGGVSTTVRAPNIGELFSPERAATFRPVDPCDQANRSSGPSPSNRAANCLAAGIPVDFTDPLTARFTGVTAGNPDLTPEESESWTAGIVLRPRFLSGFTATVDYWNIEITNAISAISAQNIVDGCYDAPSLSNQFCALFTRSPTTKGFNFLRQTDVNFAGLDVAGIDFDFNYRLNTDKFGVWMFGLGGSYLEKRNNFEFFGEPDRANPEKFELNNPEYVINTSIGWSIGALDLALTSVWLDRQLYRSVEYETLDDTVDPWAPAKWVHSLSASYQLSDGFSMILGVDNLLNEQPWRTEYSIPVSGVGRSFFLRVVGRY